MAEYKAGCPETKTFIEFNKPETKEYYEWLDKFTPTKFDNIFRYEWNKMLLMFGKGDENYVPQLNVEEMEDIYGGN